MARAWPAVYVVADFTVGPPGGPLRTAVSLSTPPLTVRSLSTDRGRQYELGFVQAGTCSLDIVDTPEYLNPVNASSPFNTGGNAVLPYRCVQVGGYWNAATRNTAGNIFNAANRPANGTGNLLLNPYDPSFEAGLGPWGSYGGNPASSALSTAQKFDGAQSVAVTFTSTTDQVGWVTPFLVTGAPVTLSMYVYVPAGTTANLAFVNYPGAPGSTIGTATSTVSGAWQRLIVTGVPSTPTCSVRLSVTGTAAVTVYVDAIQLEFGTAASAFTTSGPANKAIYSGYVERYPSKWDSAGFRGLRPLEAVDALSVLSRTVISQSYAATILADNPQIYMPLNDASAPQVVQRLTGGQRMLGYTQLGSNSGAVSFGGDAFLDGSPAVTVVQQNTSPVTLSDNTMVTFIGTRQGALSVNTQSFTLEMWVKLSSGTAYLGAGSMQLGESTIGEVSGTQKGYAWYTSRGNLGYHYLDPNGGNGPLIRLYQDSNTPWNGYPDGKWHYLVLLFPGSSRTQHYIDGVSGTVTAFGFTPSPSITVDNLHVEATTYFGDPITGVSVANVAAYATALPSAQLDKHYRRGIGYLGELSGTRVSRLLTQYWSSTFTVDTGKVPMAADFGYNGRQLLSVLQDITDTEGGLLWADAGGTVHADARDTRYVNSATSRYTFGEASGELPYADLEYDYDPTYVYSEADLTAASGTLYKTVNSTSQTAYGQRILSKSMFMANDWDVGQASTFYAQRYAKPPGAPGTNTAPRIAKFTIEPGFNPALFDAALTLDIGHRVTVKRRTSAGVTMTGDYYVEQISHKVDADTSAWAVDYQLSPVFVPQVWKLGDATNGVLGSTTTCVY